MGKFIDLSDNIFGRLTVKSRVIDDRKSVYWKCLCECGHTVEVRSDQLNRGVTKSCGCLQKERLINSVQKHGDSETSLYKRYFKLIQRCENSNDPMYKDYGGRGIRNEFKCFESFKKWAYKSGYKEYLTIDRENNDGNYSPENCRWITNKEQQSNKRNNVILKVNGKAQTLSAWAEETGISYQTLMNRIKRGWDDVDVINTPLMERGTVYRGKNVC